MGRKNDHSFLSLMDAWEYAVGVFPWNDLIHDMQAVVSNYWNATDCLLLSCVSRAFKMRFEDRVPRSIKVLCKEIGRHGAVHVLETLVMNWNWPSIFLYSDEIYNASLRHGQMCIIDQFAMSRFGSIEYLMRYHDKISLAPVNITKIIKNVGIGGNVAIIKKIKPIFIREYSFMRQLIAALISNQHWDCILELYPPGDSSALRSLTGDCFGMQQSSVTRLLDYLSKTPELAEYGEKLRREMRSYQDSIDDDDVCSGFDLFG
jgi:hypothetical protein